MEIEYKHLSDAELKKIIDKIRDTAHQTMDDVTAVENLPRNYESQMKKDQIVQVYATLKAQLKEIYHYTQLGRNDLPGHNFYNAYFCPAIRDCYLACHAKTNEQNLSKLQRSFWEIWSEAVYHSDED